MRLEDLPVETRRAIETLAGILNLPGLPGATWKEGQSALATLIKQILKYEEKEFEAVNEAIEAEFRDVGPREVEA